MYPDMCGLEKKIEKRKKGKCGDSLASNLLSQRFSNYRVSFVTTHLILITLFCFRILKTFKSPLQRFIWQNNARCFAFPARNEWTEAWKSKVSAWKNLKHFNFWKLERNKWKVWNYHDFVFRSKRVDLNSPNNEHLIHSTIHL